MITEGVFQMSIQNNNSLSTNKKVTAGVASVLLGTAVLMGGTTVHADTATPASASQPVAVVATSAAQSSAFATSASASTSSANSAAQSSASATSASALTSSANSAAQSSASASSNASSASDANSSSAVTAVVPVPTADQVTKSAVAAANIAKIEWANPEQVNKDAQSEGSYVEDLVITWKDGSVTNAKWNLFVKGTTVAQIPAPSASEVTKDPEAAKNIESVEWADPAKVNQDIQKPGEYVEHLVVTWKDGTTTTVKWNLIVKGSQDDNNNNNNNNNGNDNNNGNQNNNNGGQNNNGNNNGNQSNNGANGSTTVVNHGNGHVSVINGSVAGQIVKNNVAASNALPQTGNSSSVAVAALGAIVAMFGLGLVAKKREF